MTELEQLEKDIKTLEEMHGEISFHLLEDNEDGRWWMQLGNPSSCVLLGESRGELMVTGETIAACVTGALYGYFDED